MHGESAANPSNLPLFLSNILNRWDGAPKCSEIVWKLSARWCDTHLYFLTFSKRKFQKTFGQILAPFFFSKIHWSFFFSETIFQFVFFVRFYLTLLINKKNLKKFKHKNCYIPKLNAAKFRDPSLKISSNGKKVLLW